MCFLFSLWIISIALVAFSQFSCMFFFFKFSVVDHSRQQPGCYRSQPPHPLQTSNFKLHSVAMLTYAYYLGLHLLASERVFAHTHAHESPLIAHMCTIIETMQTLGKYCYIWSQRYIVFKSFLSEKFELKSLRI